MEQNLYSYFGSILVTGFSYTFLSEGFLCSHYLFLFISYYLLYLGAVDLPGFLQRVDYSPQPYLGLAVTGIYIFLLHLATRFAMQEKGEKEIGFFRRFFRRIIGRPSGRPEYYETEEPCYVDNAEVSGPRTKCGSDFLSRLLFIGAWELWMEQFIKKAILGHKKGHKILGIIFVPLKIYTFFVFSKNFSISYIPSFLFVMTLFAWIEETSCDLFSGFNGFAFAFDLASRSRIIPFLFGSVGLKSHPPILFRIISYTVVGWPIIGGVFYYYFYW